MRVRRTSGLGADVSTRKALTSSDSDRDALADRLRQVADKRDKAAFGELFAFFAPRVKAYLLRIGADDSQAEELAQEVLVTVWRKAHLFDRTKASPSTWVFRIARNRRIDALRRMAKPDLDPHDPSLSPVEDIAPDEAVSASEREEAVRLAMRDLPQEQLLLLRMAFFEGLSHREIAERAKVPLGTVKSRLRLAFSKLRTKLEPED